MPACRQLLVPLLVALLGAGAAQAADLVRITVTQSGCEPAAVTVPSGPASFEITNASNRAVEWEILSGVRVVAERENILPGFKQVLSVRLEAGRYELTCGADANPHGVLTVTETGAATEVVPDRT
jgi:iron uptake system component EfeO